jgi:hypothetical protein
MAIGGAERAAAEFSRTWDSRDQLRLSKPRGSLRQVSSCAQAVSVDANDVEVDSENNFHAAEWVITKCKVLRLLKKAKPARVSHVREVLRMANPAPLLPPEMAMTITDDDDTSQARAEAAGKTWTQIAKVEISRGESYLDDMAVVGDDFGGVFNWLAVGDFDGDGVEDVVATRTVGPDGGTLSESKTFILTRTKPSGRLSIVERVDK